MTISVEVARVTGWRLRAFPWTSCRDIPSLPPETQKLETQKEKSVRTEKTLPELLALLSAQNKERIKKVKADLAKANERRKKQLARRQIK